MSGKEQQAYIVPSDKVGLIIGKKGVTIKGLQQRYGVKIDTNNQQGDQTQLVVTGQNPIGCLEEIVEMIEGAGSKKGPRSFDGPTGGASTKEFFVFQINGETQELQLLLQKREKWCIPSTTEENNLAYLTAVLGGENPPMDNLGIESIKELARKQVNVVLVPRDWSGWMPSPTKEGEGLVDVTATDETLCGVTFPAFGGHMWVDVLCVLAELENFPPEVKNFFKHNMDIIVQISVYLRKQS
eukprot:m.23061 g.23061  ORF g.23061 m.23061 type:complete len:241 (-) comp8930_c0_seq1:1580-2302(-)